MSDIRFKNRYRIPSARAAWHDYSGGIYFVTICTHNREHYFGEVADGEMRLSEIGKYVDSRFQNIHCHYSYVQIPLWVVMPNHVHCIVVIESECRDAIHRVSNPSENTIHCVSNSLEDTKKYGLKPSGCISEDAINRVSTAGGITGCNNPMLSNCLGGFVRGFKARITHYANAHGISFAWQSRFHDHIIRTSDDMNLIAEYIANNVSLWETDTYYVAGV